jgi:pimeloyl-ACP methyl ester carboxylesterase
MDLPADGLAALAPPADREFEPDGFVVEVGPGERIHFLDWGGPSDLRGHGVLLVHGLAGTAWAWTAVARRLRRAVRTVSMDLRGHGLSDAPTSEYDPGTLADDLVAVAEGSGLVGPEPEAIGEPVPRRVVLAGHGYGAIVAVWAATALGERCAGLVLVDGGWQDVAEETGLTPAEFLRDLAEPPEILSSMAAYLDDRRGWDPAHWDADEERAARSTVVEVPAGHVVPAVRPHALERSVEAIFAYRPIDTLARLDLPIVGLVAVDDEEATKDAALAEVGAARRAAGLQPIDVVRFPTDGHNLLRYRPAELTGAILRLAAR